MNMGIMNKGGNEYEDNEYGDDEYRDSEYVFNEMITGYMHCICCSKGVARNYKLTSASKWPEPLDIKGLEGTVN